MLAIRGRLQLEMKGLRFKGGSTYRWLKLKYGFKGSRQKVLEQYEALLREKGILKDEPEVCPRCDRNPCVCAEYAEEVASGQHDGAM